MWDKISPWKSNAQTTPSMPPYFGALAPQPETATQKVTRAIDPTTWFGSSEQKPPKPSDPISLANPTPAPTPQLRVALAQMAEAQGNVVEARRQLEQALAQAPKDATVLREYARMEDRGGRLAEAEKFYARALAVSPKDPATRNDLGLCLARAGKLRESAQVLHSAVELNPQKALYRNNLATVLVELGDAQAAFQQLSAVHQPAVAHYNLGQLFAKRGRHSEAAHCFQTACQIDPTLQPAYAALARTQQQTVQVASRQPMQSVLVPASPSSATAAPVGDQAAGPVFPVPRSLPPVQ
jgi:Tfp pilus assembly protein PilF